MQSAGSLLSRQFGSLRVYNYRLYFFGQMISLVGTWMQTTGQAYLVLKITHSAAALGTVTALQFLPITIFTLFGGVLADRWPKRRMLMITQSLALVQALVLGLLVATGSVELWHIYVLAACLGTINALDAPVRQTFAVELVGREQLVNAVALNSSIFNVARIAGPGVAGLAIAYTGMASTFFMNAGSFVFVLGAYMLMRPADFHAGAKHLAKGNALSQVAEGIRYAVKTPSLLFLFIMLAAIGTFGFNFTVIIPLISEFVLKVGPEKFGLLTSFMGAGSLVAALVLAATGQASLRTLLIAAFGFSVLLGAIAVSRSFELTAALLVLFGVCSLVFSTTINTTLQISVPDELRGRVMSIFFLLMAGSTPIGGALTGYMADHIGVSRTIGIEAAICAAGVVLALIYRASATNVSPREEPAALDIVRTP